MTINQNTIITTPYAKIINSLNVFKLMSDSEKCNNIDFLEFVQMHAATINYSELKIILENKHSAILDFSQRVFINAIKDITNLTYIDAFMLETKNSFDNVSPKFYFFVNPWSNVCATYYIIQASHSNEAIEELIDVFESDFSVDEINVLETDNDELTYNNNGTVVNIDNVQCLGSVTFQSE